MRSLSLFKLEPIKVSWIQGARQNLIVLPPSICLFDCQAKEKYFKKQGLSRYSFGLPELSTWFGMNATPTQKSPANSMPYITVGLRPSLNINNLRNYMKFEVVGYKVKGWISRRR